MQLFVIFEQCGPLTFNHYPCAAMALLKMKSILSISNVRSWFKIDVFNSVYEVNNDMSFKNLNNIKIMYTIRCINFKF